MSIFLERRAPGVVYSRLTMADKLTWILLSSGVPSCGELLSTKLNQMNSMNYAGAAILADISSNQSSIFFHGTYRVRRNGMWLTVLYYRK